MNQNNMAYHRPVLLRESIEGLKIKPKGIYVDLTFGGGGHSRRILENLDKKGRLIAFDQDPAAEKNIISDNRFLFVNANFRYLKNFLRYHEITKVNGILADLGISSHQIDNPERGFSFRAESELDMRMNPGMEKTAVVVLNDYSDTQLNEIFREYGEIKNSSRLVKLIVRARKENRITGTSQLENILQEMIPVQQRSKFLAKIFQAIRIEVNEEVNSLKEMLVQTSGIMEQGGRLVVISYHSIEDRLVKNYMKSGNIEGVVRKDFFGMPLSEWKQVNRKVIVPGEDEIKENPRARSAKLRIAEKIG